MKVKNRVKTHEEFQEVIHSQNYVKNSDFVIYFKPNNYGYSRLGISASNKLGHAVKRVKIRRQVRAMLLELWNLEIPLDLVIIVRNHYDVEKFSECKSSLEHLLSKILRRNTNEQKF